MEPLFETKTTLTFDECVKMQKYRLRGSIFIRIPFIMLSILMIPYVLYYGLYLYAMVFAAFVWFWTFGDSLMDKMRAKKMYNSNKSLHNLELTYYFYEDYVIQESELGRTEFKYSDLYKIGESKTNFYLRDSRVSAMIIVKENCSDELCQFLRKLKVK